MTPLLLLLLPPRHHGQIARSEITAAIDQSIDQGAGGVLARWLHQKSQEEVRDSSGCSCRKNDSLSSFLVLFLFSPWVDFQLNNKDCKYYHSSPLHTLFCRLFVVCDVYSRICSNK